MRKIGATELHELVIDCPACVGTGWIKAVTVHPTWLDLGSGLDLDGLTIPCPVCGGRSWTPAVAAHVDGDVR